MGDLTKVPHRQNHARLRVIYSDGTESNLLRWSLQRALYKDDSGRRVTQPDAGPLFGDAPNGPDQLPAGTLCVLRSRSTHPTIAAHRDLIHKIGIAGALSKRGSPVRPMTRPICWPTSTSWRPTSFTRSTVLVWKD